MLTYYSSLKPFKFDYEALKQIVYFYWSYEYMLEHFVSDEFVIELAPEYHGYGPHWGGNVLWLKNKEGDKKLYIHTGMVYHPDTEPGIYFETESWKNAKYYKKLWNNLAESDKYDLNKKETEFLKVFYPKSKLKELMDAEDVDKQIELLREYFDASCKAYLAAIN